MITISDLTTAIGKRLTHCIEGDWQNYLLLRFEDGTLCQVHATSQYEDIVLEQDTDFNHECYDEQELLDAGVIDSAWLAERERLREEKRRKDMEREEKFAREQLEQLKKRFGE